MSTSIFILAAGQQVRFKNDKPKQLLEIDGKTLIQRMIDQCESYFGITPIVVSNNDDILDHMFPGENVMMPVEDEYVCDTLYSTTHLWTDQTIILLGDVYYTEQAIKMIAEAPRIAFGDEVEIYALKLQKKDWPRAKRAINVALDDAGPGKLWNFYRAFEGFPQSEQKIGGKFCLIEDETQDFDKYEEYEKFMEGR